MVLFNVVQYIMFYHNSDAEEGASQQQDAAKVRIMSILFYYFIATRPAFNSLRWGP